MNARELGFRLIREGCNPTQFAIGSIAMRGTPPLAFDCHCITFDGAEWHVFFTDRQGDQPPLFSSPNEALACDFFFERIMAMRHEHCVGSFKSCDRADELFAKLESLGLAPFRDTIAYGGVNDPRHRVHVIGKAIFAAREAVGGETPVQD